MSTPKLKKGPEDAVRNSGVYFSVETPSQLVLRGAHRMSYLVVEYVGIYTIQSGRIQDGRPHPTGECRKGRQWDGGGSPMGGGGDNRTKGGSRKEDIWGEST